MGTSNTRIDWHVFETNFSTDIRGAFQQLTEQLFCYKYRQPYGIFRFYNQPYIETMPIIVDTRTIGFQAKYFDASTKLSDKVEELCSAITGAHAKYPTLTHIVLYINKEFGISTKTDQIAPSYMQTIEKHAEGLSITIEWCGLSQIETILLHPDTRFLRDYFFSTDYERGLRYTLNEIKSHGNSILRNISIHITCRDKTFEFPQPDIHFNSFLESDKKCLIIHGDGGCGKSALIKKQIGNEHDYPIWIFRASDFDCVTTHDFVSRFGSYSWDDLLRVFDNATHKVCIIESAEKVCLLDNQEVFWDMSRSLIEHGWRIVVTIRSQYKDLFINSMREPTPVEEINVSRLTNAQLSEFEQNEGIVLPADTKLRELLCTLFYLNMYTSRLNLSGGTNREEFLDCIWRQVICGTPHQNKSLHIQRNIFICKMVRSNADSGTYYYIPCDTDNFDALGALQNSGIVEFDDQIGGYYLCHDVYEEIVLHNIIQREFSRKSSTMAFFESIGDGVVMRKAFRTWLQQNIANGESRISTFICDALHSSQISSVWKDEIIVVLMGEDNSDYLNLMNSVLEHNDFAYLPQALRLLTTACKVVDDTKYRSFLTTAEEKMFNIYLFTKPSGSGWAHIISFIHTHQHEVPWNPLLIMLTLDTIHEWVKENTDGNTTREAGQIALYLYNHFCGAGSPVHLESSWKHKLCNTIVGAARMLKPELTHILQTVIESKETRGNAPYTLLCSHMLQNSFQAGEIWHALPTLAIGIAKLFWFGDSTGIDTEDMDYYRRETDIYGLRDHLNHKYYPSSAFQSPVLKFLNTNPKYALPFIIELFNTVTEAYVQEYKNKYTTDPNTIQIHISEGFECTQVCNGQLWAMYRGMSAGPHLLESILMALERWLDTCITTLPSVAAVAVCKHLLQESKSVAITAVVLSMVMAHPDKLFEIACILLQNHTIFFLDRQRKNHESGTNLFRGNLPKYELLDKERIASNKLPLREKCFEEIIINYQLIRGDLSTEEFEQRRNTLFESIDRSFLPEENLTTEERFLLYRIDTRHMKWQSAPESIGKNAVALVPELPQELIDVQENNQHILRRNQLYYDVFLWGTGHFNRKAEQYNRYLKYDENPEAALEDALDLCNEPAAVQTHNDFILYVASALISEFSEQISPKAIDTCCKLITAHLIDTLDSNSIVSAEDGTDAAIAALPYMIHLHRDTNTLQDPTILLFSLLIHHGQVRRWAIQAFRNILWRLNSDMAKRLVFAYMRLYPEFKELKKYPHKKTTKACVEAYLDQIVESLSGEVASIDQLDETAQLVTTLLLPVDSHAMLSNIVLTAGKTIWPIMFARSHYQDGDTIKDDDLLFDYIEWLALTLLLSSSDLRSQLSRELFPCLAESRNTESLLIQLIQQKDRVFQKAAFWYVWEQLLTPIGKIISTGSRYGNAATPYAAYFSGLADGIITTYLFAWNRWAENCKEWHTIDQNNVAFFERISLEMNAHPSVLFSFSALLGSVGSCYAEQGVNWIYNIITQNPDFVLRPIPVNTEYNLGEYIHRFIVTHRRTIRKSPELKKQVITILDFLIARGFTMAYLMRESIC